ncbi:dihydroneopterin aldolase [Ehrlichia ruminantium]|uniref:Dihydroneopterin aldolase/epimerase domain-containing protein n=1 Tax=Ehrlichia ruminantium (strain Welgevonden) TaxID=254945 RepID=A0A0H3M643_EHRRW|nr:dihydroneopterin aldolase [Ehrlichia ruminantium]KYW93991.1 dihydroneopterin aldolase [Ehrlichia ruminantium]QLK50486.1 dihydroneopterin aldolase [Ehrlichia ruminantium]QLK51411.1 dihydroneopterin aldolase [Ehrlichia ruminantium]QLK53245.1 dihydroneopterin aldolase [Ehrlichia ruminantium]QLK55084.1 dihydroneopterin aldolase [Ehrlichia ruminantium]
MKIQINDLIAYSQVGIRCWENVLKQRIVINCEITLKFYDSICDINYTIDYHEFTNNLINFVSSHKFSLLETLVLELMDYIMQDDRIAHCCLKVHKCLACGKNANVSIELQRFAQN